MGNAVMLLVSLIIMIVGVLLVKTYQELPVKELKRQARYGNRKAALLYRAVGHGAAMEAVLWTFIGLSGATVFFIVANKSAWWIALLVLALIIWVVFAWLPKSKLGAFGKKIVLVVTPTVEWVIIKLRPLFQKLGFHHRDVPSKHTGIYELEDILELLEKQKTQADNRISEADIDIAKNALTYSEREVIDVMTPKGVVKSVSASEINGLALMDELHKSGFSRFPVYQESENTFVGTLYLKDVIATKDAKSVGDMMQKSVYYVQAHSHLNQVLDAFLKTKHHLFMVVDEFEDVLGIVTIEDVLEAILGRQIIDEFDNYDNLRAVAAHRAKNLKKSHGHVVPDEPKLETLETSDQ